MGDSENYKLHRDTNLEAIEGVEVEQEGPYNIDIKRPFNPEEIKVRTVNIVVEQLVSRIQHKEIDLSPDFQRLRGIWKINEKSRLIESFLLRIPIPVFYVSANNEDDWAVVDGVQRMSTVYDYIKGNFTLKGLEYLSQLEGITYENLPRNMRRRINETQLIVNVIEPGTPSEVMFNIFNRINTGGMTLNGQEIRHALNPGPVRDYLKILAETDEFLSATDESIKKLRMADRECVLRFLAFYVNSWESYRGDDLDGFLVDAMRKINLMTQSERNDLMNIFTNAMVAAKEIFLDDAFRKRYFVEDQRNPINKALFEAWGVGLANCSFDEIEVLVRKRKKIKSEFIKLLNKDWDFEGAISTSTGSQKRVKKRFSTIESFIQRFL